MNWQLKTIGEITEVVTKGTTPSTYGMPFTDEGINFVKAEALNGDVTLDRNGFTFIDDETHEKLKRSQLHQNDVLITIAGANVGKCGYVREAEVPANTNQAVGIVRVKPTEANPRYIYYHFKQPSTFAMCQGIGGGQAAQPNINLTVLKTFKVNLPDTLYQDRVVEIVGAYDDLIENNKRRIELLEESARQLYKEWFVRFRFPGHEHVKIIDGVPERWTRTTADQAIEILSGGTPKTTIPEYWDGDIGFFTPKDSTNTVYVSNTEKTITSLGLERCASKLYPKNTLFITARGTVGKLNLAQKPTAINQSCYALVGKESVNQIYLFFAMQAGIQQVKSRAVGAVFDAIIKDTFKVIPFVVPPESLIAEFTDFAKPIIAQIDFLLTSTEKLTQARDILLPKLMNGEVAV